MTNYITWYVPLHSFTHRAKPICTICKICKIICTICHHMSNMKPLSYICTICTPHFADATSTSGILTPCRNAIYYAYTCIYMFEIMHVSIYNAYSCIYIQWYIAFQGDFPMFVHSRILVTWDDIVIASKLKKLYAHFGFVLTLFIHGIYLYIPCISWYVACFHIAQDKSVIFLL